MSGRARLSVLDEFASYMSEFHLINFHSFLLNMMDWYLQFQGLAKRHIPPGCYYSARFKILTLSLPSRAHSLQSDIKTCFQHPIQFREVVLAHDTCREIHQGLHDCFRSPTQLFYSSICSLRLLPEEDLQSLALKHANDLLPDALYHFLPDNRPWS